jgi:hypothetical protein
MITKFLLGNVVVIIVEIIFYHKLVIEKEEILLRNLQSMVCFCGCENFEKDPNGFKAGCVKCNHGAQNHDTEFREASRANESQSQKRDTDFG